jgi:hypothetical protein
MVGLSLYLSNGKNMGTIKSMSADHLTSNENIHFLNRFNRIKGNIGAYPTLVPRD